MSSSATKGRQLCYREARDFTSRQELSASLREKYPACVPVIVERADCEKTLPVIDKRQFLAPYSMTVGSFLFIVRTRLGLPSQTSLWLYAGKTALSQNSDSMADAYKAYHDTDGFLYLQYRGEDAFGGDDIVGRAVDVETAAVVRSQ